LQQPAIINANGRAHASFTYTYANACTPPTAVTFNNTTTSNTPANYQWYFGDGGSSTSQSPVYTYALSGTFQAQLIASTGNGCHR